MVNDFKQKMVYFKFELFRLFKIFLLIFQTYDPNLLHEIHVYT